MNFSGGDWICCACQHHNFRRNEVCQQCGYPKYDGPDPAGWTRVLPGDWYCTALNCGAHNYARRPSCYKCGSFKIDFASTTGCSNSICGSPPDATFPPGWKTGDWICSRIGCGVHNYARRTECYRCRTPRDFGGAVE